MKFLIHILSFFTLTKLTLTTIFNNKTVMVNIFSTGERYQLKMKIGTPYIIKNHVINQEKDMCWFYTILYDSSFSNTSQFQYSTLEGDIFTDIFQFENSNITFQSFPYQIGNRNLTLNSSVFGGGFTFPYKFNNTNQSLTHQLLLNNHINYLSYALILNNKQIGKKLIFGGLPETITQEKFKGKCKVNPNRPTWSCSMTSISLGSYKYNTTHHEAYFQMAEKVIRAPNDFMDYMLDVIFLNKIQAEQCDHVDRKYIFCRFNTSFADFPYIQFTIDNYVYSIPTSTLLDSILYLPHFLIQRNEFNDNTWIIGDRFLSHFDSLFDYERGMVELYSNEVTISEIFIIDYLFLQYLCFVSLLILMISGLCFVLYLIFEIDNLLKGA